MKVLANPYSAIKVFHHADALDALLAQEQRAPFYIRLKPTNLCNHHCAYCTYGSGDTEEKTANRDDIKHTDMIPWLKMQEVIKDMGDMGLKAVTFSGGGEPLTYPHIKEAVQLIQDNGIELSLITNGSLLGGDIAKSFYAARWIRVSFDSPVPETYAALRGVSEFEFERVIGNIKNFAINKDDDCVLGINFVISKANYKEVYEAAKLVKKLGVDNIKFAAVVENVPQYHLSIKDEVIEQIHAAVSDFQDETFRIINNYENDWMDKNFSVQPFSTCYTCRLVTVIAADQRVYLCHTRAYDSHAIVGDLHDNSFKEMWFSEETKAKLSQLKPMIECKNFCVYQERNQLIQAYFDVDMKHVNFI